MNNQSIRDIFDTISLSVISFLEDLKRVTEIDFSERHGVAEMSLSKWEEEHSPFKLPDDYKSFLQISDGLLLTWKIVKNGIAYPLGMLHLNKLREIIKFPIEHFKLSAVGEDDLTSDDDSDEDTDADDDREGKKKSRKKDSISAFDIDNKVQDGRVALLYKNTYTKPQVWFQDLSCSWFFIANTFTDYFRLMIMHLGIPHWQYVFTNVGLPPISMQWFRYLSPDRLAIDIENRNKKVNEGSRKKKSKHDKIEGLKRKKRRMKSKLKGASTHNFEKFSTSASKNVKFASKKVKKSEQKGPTSTQGPSTQLKK